MKILFYFLLGLLTLAIFTVYIIFEERAECLSSIENFDIERPAFTQVIDLDGEQNISTKALLCIEVYSVNGLYRWVKYGEGLGADYFKEW